MNLLFRYLGTVAAVFLTIYIVPGVEVAGLPAAPGTAQAGGWATVFLVALLWSAISLTIKPILHMLALPITILTFGIFALVLNALLFWLVSVIVPGFTIDGFVAALFGSIVLSILSWLIHGVFKPRATM